VTNRREPFRYSELTPDLLNALRIMAALEQCYPKHGDRCQRTLAGYAEWIRCGKSAPAARPAERMMHPREGHVG